MDIFVDNKYHLKICPLSAAQKLAAYAYMFHFPKRCKNKNFLQPFCTDLSPTGTIHYAIYNFHMEWSTNKQNKKILNYYKNIFQCPILKY